MFDKLENLFDFLDSQINKLKKINKPVKTNKPVYKVNMANFNIYLN